ncbi:MAG: hypothetical protein ACRENE_26780 [Polyangiaceae bacterium]
MARVVSLRALSTCAPRFAAGAGLVAVAAAAASFDQACSVGVLSALGDDAGIDAGPVAGGSSGGGLSTDATACQPGDVRTYVPQAYTAASAPLQAVCTSDELTKAYQACIDPTTATKAACREFSDLDASTALCGACVLTPLGAGRYGPFVDHGTFVTENASGCIELNDPGPGGLTCAKAQQALDGCELAACAAFCPAYDSVSHDVLDTCMTAAAAGGCQMFAAQASCTSAVAEAGLSAQCTGLDFHDFFFAVAPLFCGPLPAPDAGTGSTDGAIGGDASADSASSDAALPEGSPADGSPSDAPAAGDAAGDAPAD